ncbi:BQ5605_C027g10439 [Microbotryum silenes-dioicae]|uniref:BQ5605_C027g10439 protein n=1 Tax=Microbotryum silenes-dioicae TaxID=796604 RepID=A0A2X0PGW0_9BASI|nr:BQ5605_C027g10439 [Microbotryum silenes-dioicae]
MPQVDRFRVSHRTFPSDHRRTRISLCQTAGTTALCTILITQRASVPG